MIQEQNQKEKEELIEVLRAAKVNARERILEYRKAKDTPGALLSTGEHLAFTFALNEAIKILKLNVAP